MNRFDTRADLQRLADGELPQGHRAKILRALPADSAHWRELALAFVERQVLDESLTASGRIGGTPDGGAGESSALQPNRKPFNGVANARSRPERNERWGARALWIAAIGASLMIGIALGNWRASGNSSTLESVATVAESPPTAAPANGAATAKHEHLGMPLAEALSRAAYPIPVDLRRELMKRGYLITELDQLSKVQLPTGQLVELPVRQVAVTYLGNATYQ